MSGKRFTWAYTVIGSKSRKPRSTKFFAHPLDATMEAELVWDADHDNPDKPVILQVRTWKEVEPASQWALESSKRERVARPSKVTKVMLISPITHKVLKGTYTPDEAKAKNREYYSKYHKCLLVKPC